MSRSFSALRRVARAALTSIYALTMLIGVANTATAQTITTVAGTTDIAGRPARSISVRPAGLVMAPVGGTVYVADSDHAQVLRFDPVAQTFTVVAGTTVAGYSGDGGPATSAQLNFPSALILDASGNLLIAETGNGRIRKVDFASGQISTVAGGGWSSHDGDLAINARLDGPSGIAVGADGSIYVSEFEANRVRRVTPSGMIFTIAGTGIQGSSGDGGAAVNAQLSRPSALAFDALGNLYISDQANWSIRVIDAVTGIIHRFAGTGTPAPVVYDGFPALESPLAAVSAMAFDAQGNLIYTDQPIGRVRKIDAITTVVTTIGGTGYEFENVPAINGRIDSPYGLALASSGDIYVSSQNRFLMQRISGMTGMLEVVAGNGAYHFSGDNGPAKQAQVMPLAIVANIYGDVFIADESRIRKINGVTGVLTAYAGGAECCSSGDGGLATNAFLYGPQALAIDGVNNLYVSDYGSHRIRKINAVSGLISHYAGTGYGFAGDNGPAINATMGYVRDLATDAAGNLFILDDYSSRVRRVDAATGIITTIAGNGQYDGPLNDGSLATQVALSYPTAIAVDRLRNVYIGTGMRIRKVDAITGVITTIAGNGSWGDAGDGGPAINASLRPDDMIVDSAGNIFITSRDSNRVRKIDAATGIIATVAGTGAAGYAGDNGPAVLALLQNPRSLALSAKNLLVAETFHVRRIADAAAAPVPGDTSAPVIWYTLSAPTTSAAGWHNTDVTVTWTVSEPESTISASSGCATTSITSDTGGVTLICTATSVGGTTSKSVTIKRDTFAPTITFGAPTPAPNAAGWYKVDPSMPYTKSDSLSGISGSATGTISMIGQGANIKYGIAFIDKAGNQTDAVTPGVNIDKIAPTATITSPANGATYAVGAIVNAAFACNDGHSGIGSCIASVPNGTAIDTATAGSKTFVVTVTDVAGNAATVSSTYTVSGIAPPPPPPPPPGTPTYCSSRGSTSTWEWIRSTQFGASTNTSNNNGGYGNFSANAPISLQRGSNTIVVTPGFNPGSSYVEYWRVWIDFDKDGTFASSEQVFATATSSALSTSFIVPSFAPSGSTRMRVSMKWGSAPSPCETFTYGEVEDYQVTIP